MSASPLSNPVGRIAGLALVGLLAAACSSAATASPPPVTAAPADTSAPAATAAPAATQAPASGGVVITTAAGILTGPTGMALYTRSGDSATTSSCTGGCLTAWPALVVPAGGTATGGTGVSGTIATLTRADNGAIQVTYNGLPLYYFASDSAAGTATGDGVGGFSVAKP